MKRMKKTAIASALLSLPLLATQAVAVDYYDFYNYRAGWLYNALTLQATLGKQPITTHNSYNSAEYKTWPLSLAYADPQQELTITGQLDAGARNVNIDVIYANGLLRACHWGGPVALREVFCTPSDSDVRDQVAEITTWLRRPEHRNEVVSLYFDHKLDGVHNSARLMSEILESHADMIYVPAGGGCNAPTQHLSDAQLVALGKRLIITGVANECVAGKNAASVEVGNYSSQVDRNKPTYDHTLFKHNQGSFAGGFSGEIWSNNYVGYPTCSFGSYVTINDILQGYGAPSEDRTEFSRLNDSGTHRIEVDEVRELSRCGVQIQWDMFGPKSSDRLRAAIWSWSENQPDNYGSNEHCAEIANWNGGKFNDATCSASLRFVCQNIENKADFRITTQAGSWQNGFDVCINEYGTQYQFSVPTDGYQMIKANDARAATGNPHVWVAYTDQNKEGKWTTVEHATDYWKALGGLWNADSPNNYGNNEDCAVLVPNANAGDVPCSSSYRPLCYLSANGSAHGNNENAWTVANRSGSWQESEAICQEIGARFMMPADKFALAAANQAVQNTREIAWINYSDIREEGNWQASLTRLAEIVDDGALEYKGPFGLNGFARLRNDNGYCLDIEGGDGYVREGRVAEQWSCHDDTSLKSQLWKQFPDGTIRPYLNTNLCLDVWGARTANGDKVGLWTCNTSANQKWTWRLHNQLAPAHAPWKALEITTALLGNGGDALVWNMDGATSQRWHWDTLSSYVFLRNKASGRCLDVPGDDNAFSNGQRVQLWDCQNHARDQKWRYSEKTRRFQNKANPNFCLDYAGQTWNGGAMALHTCVDHPNLQFNADGDVIRDLLNSSFVLDASGTGNGAAVTSWGFHGGNNQRWDYIHNRVNP